MRRSPRDTQESNRTITRRALMLGVGQTAIVAGLALRMRQMQVVEARQYRLLSDKNRINIRLIPPPRGLIFDRQGVLLAGNEQNYSVVIVREDAGDVPAVLARLAEIVPITPEEIARTIRDVHRHSAFVPVTISDRLSWDDLSRIAVNSPALPGISPAVGLSRTYPLGVDLGHVVGYVGPVSEADLRRIPNPDPLLQIPKFQIGKVGVEAKLEDELRGKAGLKRIEVNSLGRVIRELDRQPSQPGEDIQLTIDARLQDFTMARLSGESAAAVAMDLETGDVLACTSSPSFNPNYFVRGISSKIYNGYRNNEYRPLVNKAVQGIYPPGSTFKIVTALAALTSGKLKLTDKIYCPGYIIVGGRRFNCWNHAGHGWLDLEGAITQSCDVFFYEAGQRAGIDMIGKMARHMGLGKRHDMPMSAISSGLVPSRAWKKRRFNQSWLIGDTINAAIGQGYVLASPLQLAVMVSRLASGKLLQPRLVKSVNGVEVPIVPPADLGIAGQYVHAVRQGTFGVVNGARGTARNARIIDPQMTLAGKTGTSQVHTLTAADRAAGMTTNHVPWKYRDHALFVCYAPFDKPKVAVAIVIEHGGPEHQAAPMARDIMLYALTGSVPPLAAYPRYDRQKVEAQFKSMTLHDFTTPPTTRSRA